jgi:anaphase-promoting complex subunit 2
MWRPTLGTVEVEIMRGDFELTISVSTMEAAVLQHFTRQERWGQDDLAAEMGINRATLRRKAVVWINNGLLVEEKADDVAAYRLTTGDDGRAAFGAAAADDEGGGGGAVASAEDQAAAGMMVYEQYVMGMLTNFPSLPPDRIHNMLKMFVQDPPYDRSLDQLEAFLGQLVAEDKLALEGNSYSKR